MEPGTVVANYSHSFVDDRKENPNFQSFVPYTSYYCMFLFWYLVIRAIQIHERSPSQHECAVLYTVMFVFLMWVEGGSSLIKSVFWPFTYSSKRGTVLIPVWCVKVVNAIPALRVLYRRLQACWSDFFVRLVINLTE